MSGGKNEVTLTFAGDSTQLEKAFDRVGKAADDMESKVKDSGEAFDNAAEKFDTVDTRAMGFRDTITGVQDSVSGFSRILKGDLSGDALFTAGAGIGDLASGFANMIVPMSKAAVQMGKTVAQVVGGWILMGINAMRQAFTMAAAWVISLGPAALIIAAVAAVIGIIVALWLKSSAFRDFFIGLWDKIWGFLKSIGGWFAGPFKDFFVDAFNKIKGAVSGAYNWIRDKFNAAVDFVKKLPGRIGKAASGMWDGIKNAFRGALNWIIDKWNAFHITLPSIDTHIPGIGKIGGFTLNTPDLPRFHSGGTVPGAPGQEMLAILQAGERVIPAGAQQPVQVQLNISGSGSFATMFLEAVRKGQIRLAVNGGQVAVSA